MTITAQTYTAERLCNFEERVKAEFLTGNIRSPVHLSDPNQAEHLLEVFQQIKDTDWVCASWRSHFHALLKGIPEDKLFQTICAGRSMMIHSRKNRFLTSAIVGGMAPTAVGLAKAIQLQQRDERVWLFVGDMTSMSGIVKECMEYAKGWGLPLTVVVEDNGLSTNSPTWEVWGKEDRLGFEVQYYQYQRDVPHTGVGQWVEFR